MTRATVSNCCMTISSAEGASVLGEAYREMLRGGVRYWNGSAWTAKPAMNRR